MSIDRELEMILYSTPESDVTVSAIIKDETLWLNQKSLAELFNVDISTINQHLKNIFETQELEQNSTIGKFPIVQTEGKRTVRRTVTFYNLDAIISVGYRVNSKTKEHKITKTGDLAMTNQISCFFIHYSFCFFLSILQSFCESPTPAFLRMPRSSATGSPCRPESGHRF